jgi:streptogramin lyase
MRCVGICVLVACAVLLAANAGDGVAKGEGPTSLAAGFGSLWVGMGNGDVLRFDAESGRREARLKSEPTGFVHGLVVGYDAVWLVRDRVTRVEPRHNATRDIPKTGSATAFGIAAGAGSVWVADDGANEILRIEPDRVRVLAHIRIPGRARGVAAGPGNVIVVSVPTEGPVSGPGGVRFLRRLDPKTNELSAPLARLTCDVGVAQVSHAIWTLDACTGILTRRDPHTLKVRGQKAVHVLSQAPILGFGSLWLARRGGTLRVDPTTLSVVADIPARSVTVAVGSGYVWALDVGGARRRPSVRKIDPRTNRVVGSPVFLAANSARS